MDYVYSFLFCLNWTDRHLKNNFFLTFCPIIPEFFNYFDLIIHFKFNLKFSTNYRDDIAKRR